MSLEDLTEHELVLLKSALLAYRDCGHCQKEYPMTHGKVLRYILPKIKKLAVQRFAALVDLNEQTKFLHNEKEAL
jgi:hypothetical protein